MSVVTKRPMNTKISKRPVNIAVPTTPVPKKRFTIIDATVEEEEPVQPKKSKKSKDSDESELTDEEYDENIKRIAEIKKREIDERLAKQAARDALPQELKDWRQKKENDIKIEQQKLYDEMDRLNDRLAELGSLSSDYRRGDMDEEFYKVPDEIPAKGKIVRKKLEDFLQDGDIVRRKLSDRSVNIYGMFKDGKLETIHNGEKYIFDTLNALSVFHTKVVLGRKFEPNAWKSYEGIRNSEKIDLDGLSRKVFI